MRFAQAITLAIAALAVSCRSDDAVFGYAADATLLDARPDADAGTTGDGGPDTVTTLPDADSDADDTVSADAADGSDSDAASDGDDGDGAGSDAADTDSGDTADGGDAEPPDCHSLRFDSEASVVVPHAVDLELVGTDFTVEYWAKHDPLGRSSIDVMGLHTPCPRGGDACSGWALTITEAPFVWPTFWDFLMASDEPASDKTRGASPIPESRWTHVAMTYSVSENEAWFWIDGRAVSERLLPERRGIRSDAGDLRIGHRAPHFDGGTSFPGLAGAVAGVRMSSVIRYRETFVPATSWRPDADTIALWAFDDGAGATLADSSGNGHDGTIEGATWSDEGPACSVIPAARSLAERCAEDDECASGACADDVENADLHRCAPPRQAYVPAGTFVMGSPEAELGRADAEVAHTVTLTRAFFIDATEVTRADWTARMGDAPWPSDTCGRGCPATHVSWWDALAYANAASEEAGLPSCYRLVGCADGSGAGRDCASVVVASDDGTPYTCSGYRLPTSAEWEYVARAGTATATYGGDLSGIDCDDTTLLPIAWFCGNAVGRVHPTAALQANAWGAWDMLGNVYEWVWDGYEAYDATPVTDPATAFSEAGRVNRGGGFGSPARDTRAATVGDDPPEFRGPGIGFRLARTVP